MSATKILWGQITVVFLIVLFTTWAATQYVAWSLGFQVQLGSPWFAVLGVPIYYPPAFFWWWYFYDAYAPEIFTKGAFIAASGGFITIAVAIGMSVCSSTPSRLRSGALRSLGAISSIAASMPEVAAWQRASIAGSPT